MKIGTDSLKIQMFLLWIYLIWGIKDLTLNDWQEHISQFWSNIFHRICFVKIAKKTFSITSKYFKYSHLRLMNEQTQITYAFTITLAFFSWRAFVQTMYHKRLTLKMMWKSTKISSGNRKLVLIWFYNILLTKIFLQTVLM